MVVDDVVQGFMRLRLASLRDQRMGDVDIW